MNLAEFAMLLGELKNGQEETLALLRLHIAEAKTRQENLESRLEPMEKFMSRSTKIANIVGGVVTGLISFLTLKWFKE